MGDEQWVICYTPPRPSATPPLNGRGVGEMLLAEDFLETSLEHLSTKATLNDYALRVDEYIVGDTVYLINRGGSTFPAFEVGDLEPRQASSL